MLRLRVASDCAAAHEERPAGPQHHGCCKGELNPVGQRGREPVRAEMVAHLDGHHRHRKRKPDPEAARHVDEFGIGTGGSAWHLRLQRHAADRAGAGADLADLWVHRAGVDRACDHWFRFALLEKFLRIGGELGAAVVAAEIISRALVVSFVLGGRRIDAHAADRIDRASSRRGAVMMVFGRTHGPRALLSIPPGGI